MREEPSADSPKRSIWRFTRFGMRGFLVVTTITSIFLGVVINSVRQQRKAIEWIRERQGSYSYDTKRFEDYPVISPIANWLSHIFGKDYVWRIDSVSLQANRSGASEHDITPLLHLPYLKSLDLSRNASVEDISAIQNMKSLQELDLNHTSVADIQPLGNMASLRRLDLSFSRVDDLSRCATQRPLRL